VPVLVIVMVVPDTEQAPRVVTVTGVPVLDTPDKVHGLPAT
jgi:hypothetical protein